jgi:hypothetical protein
LAMACIGHPQVVFLDGKGHLEYVSTIITTNLLLFYFILCRVFYRTHYWCGCWCSSQDMDVYSSIERTS